MKRTRFCRMHRFRLRSECLPKCPGRRRHSGMNKRIASFLSIILFAAVLLCGSVGFSGCQSTGGQVVNTSRVTHVGVAAGMRAYNEYLTAKDAELVAMGKTEPDKARVEREKIGTQTARIRAAYDIYRESQLAVLKAAREFSRIPPEDTNAPAASDKLAQAVTASTPARAAVIDALSASGISVAK